MKATIRLAKESDALPMLAIYAPLVRETSISFEVEPPSETEFRQRIQEHQTQFPWLVCEIDEEVLGYAGAIPYFPRDAYQWSVRSFVYVSIEHRRKGVAKALYTSLFKLLQLQRFYNVYAAIALPNPASVALHESIGFSSIGIFQSAGYKLGKWHDVGWWQLFLQRDRAKSVNQPLSLQKAQTLSLWDKALNRGLPLLQV
ncbi:MAG: N-acetyltransferase family protein [Oscillatoriaceae cyanobacterium Prado104]|jgi:phosphinothricin acetyltransferase|nr:N-acetyltransferase family protein [Oscillatoriaceae cyanobacterium Prado104]